MVGKAYKKRPVHEIKKLLKSFSLRTCSRGRRMITVLLPLRHTFYFVIAEQSGTFWWITMKVKWNKDKLQLDVFQIIKVKIFPCWAQETKNNMTSYFRVVSLLLLSYGQKSCQTKAVICIITRYALPFLSAHQKFQASLFPRKEAVPPVALAYISPHSLCYCIPKTMNPDRH